jgi:hypothetical protein
MYVHMARFEMRVPDELLVRIDSARGSVPRATWIKEAIEMKLMVVPLQRVSIEDVKRDPRFVERDREVARVPPEALPEKILEKRKPERLTFEECDAEDPAHPISAMKSGVKTCLRCGATRPRWMWLKEGSDV